MKLPLLFTVAFFLFIAQTNAVALTSPRPGETLRGQVTITGTTDVPNFLAAQLDFKYASDSRSPDALSGTDNWFTLQAFAQPALDSALYAWDTASITDGEYLLRLQVFLLDGGTQEVTIPIIIQNDSLPATPTSPPATPTPESIFSGGQNPTPFLLALSPTPTNVPRPTPTSLPDNPLALKQTEIVTSLIRGALIIMGVFLLAGLILRLRRT